VPGVAAAGVTNAVPLGGAPAWSFIIEGQTADANGVQDAETFAVSPGYFRTLEVPLRAGRLFEPQDGPSTPRVALISQTLARRYFAGRDPLGGRISVDDGTTWHTVVGVVGDVRAGAIQKEPYPQLYFPSTQQPRRMMFLTVRTEGAPEGLVGSLRREVAALDADLPVSDVLTMEQRLGRAVAKPQVNVLLLGGFAAVALLLAGIGIYGVISQMVAQRTREIGIRMALGARSNDVLRLMIRQGITPALVGIALGLVAALAGSRLLESLLYGVSATDPLSFVIVPVFLAGVALFATWLPARRATRIDPTEALRQE